MGARQRNEYVERLHLRDLPRGTLVYIKTRSDELEVFIADPWNGDVTVWSKRCFGQGKNLHFEGATFGPGGPVLPPKRLVLGVGMDLEFIDPKIKLFKSGRVINYLGTVTSIRVVRPSGAFDQNPNAKPHDHSKWM